MFSWISKKVSLCSAGLGIAVTLMFPTGSRLSAQVNPTPPCSNEYGSGSQPLDIELAMYSGSAADVSNAINAAKTTRGTSCGCYSSCLTYSPVSNTTEPSISTIISVWNSNHASHFSSFSNTCPPIGRVWGAQALAGYYAILAKTAQSSINAPQLSDLKPVADAFVAAQYGPNTASAPYAYQMGAYPFLNAAPTDACYPLGKNYSPGHFDSCGNPTNPSSDPIGDVCTNHPGLCQPYSAGMYSTTNGFHGFLVGDIDASTDYYEGDIGYDHGWAGIMMLESAIQQPSATTYSNSLQLAAQFAASEPPVLDHNYTAKMIWLLAEAYDWTGNNAYKTALLDKLGRGLLPGVLTDFQTAGYVDGLTNPAIPFSSLTTVAQPVGRMWDGHNSLPVYMAMNAWALAEAYVALHDKGDTTDAATVYGYLIPMLDNLASEINSQGIPHVKTYSSPTSYTDAPYGTTQIPYALLIGLWKVASIDGLQHQNWHDAIARLWNDQLSVAGFGDQSVNVALYMLYKSGVPYTALSQRGGTPPTFYPPAAYSVLSGTRSSGSLVSLFTDDSDFLAVGSSSTPQVGVLFNIPPVTVHSLTIIATTMSSASGTPRSLYIWDYTKPNNNWTLINSDTVGTAESTISGVVNTNVSNYIQSGSVQVGVLQNGNVMSVNFVQLQGQ